MIARLAGLPPAWLGLFALAGAALGWLLPLELPPALRDLGLLLVAAALALMLWAAFTMWRARTTVIPGRLPAALVTHGPFRFSRNPIYLADLILLAGLMLALSAPAGLVAVPALALVLKRRFILREETVIAAAYGAAFDRYRKRVRRWI
ncbi:methyltransferase family protein [Paracoccus thiocyanatus]|uniref:Isoprenylcysteine carboxylmethyltransferase family protein n=1 Tax=Paracoccus thiocyanatus TaxID=34006 RepID=A0A3D8PA29_9RHOB|nr:isoprenylcysteine carboxylmethyltransferase family protein [Paracoccus thiocyanatus]RDW12482.1 isoprenylcysteine carboxylmethyltransferase family protein [Paracoccus thiocyanatus]